MSCFAHKAGGSVFDGNLGSEINGIQQAFESRRRFLSADCELLVHERKLKKVLHLDGALKACATQVKNTLAEIQSGERLEREGFEELIIGSSLNLEDLQSKVCTQDWYIPAKEARELGLVAGLVG